MRNDLRLAVPVVFAWAILALLIGLPDELQKCAVLLWSVSLVVLGCAWWLLSRGMAVRLRSLAVLVSVACGCAAMLVSFAAADLGQRRPGVLVEAASAGRFVTATVVTTQMMPGTNDTPSSGTGGAGAKASHPPFHATATTVTIGGKHYAVSVPLAVFSSAGAARGSAGASDPGIGTSLGLSGTLVATEAGDDVSFLLFATREPTVIANPPVLLDWANGLRTSFRGATSSLAGDGGDLLPGLAIGDTSAVSPTLDSEMKATSLSHLTAVSGSNCAVVIALIMLVGAALRLPRVWRVLLAILALLGFVVLVTPEPSVLRAAVMAAIMLGAFVSGRPMRGVPTLALAAIVLLSLDPWLARSYGFVLSVLATAGLLVLSGPLTRVLARWLPLWLAATLAIPLAAQLACQPVLILLNPTIPVYGVIANVLAEPAAPVATVLGLVACLLVPVAPPVADLVLRLAWVPSAWIAAVAHFFAALPGSAIEWPSGAVGVGVTALGVVLLLTLMLVRRRGVRAGAACVVAIVLVVVGGATAGQAFRLQLSRPSNWQIAACDIGQGDAVLVRSEGRVALIDTGPDPKLLSSCLAILGIAQIDLLVLSHWDMDHVGGTSAVFGRVTRALIGPSDHSAASAFGRELAKHGAAVQQVGQGLSGELGDLDWQILWPRAPLGGVEPGNDASVVVAFAGGGRCNSGCLSSLFLGDLGNQPQQLFMSANPLAGVDVVKVAHHGSADQNPRLYNTLRAAVGIISVGRDNDYGHPTAALLGILRASDTQAFRTDLQGMILISPGTDGAVSVWTEHPMPPHKREQH